MLAFDLQAPGGPRLRYSFVSYVPARQLVSESGLVARRWWIDTDERLAERPTWYVELEPLAGPLLALSRQATSLRERFHQQHARWPTGDDAGWLASQPAAPADVDSPEACFLRGAFLFATPTTRAATPEVAPAPVATTPVVTAPGPSAAPSVVAPPATPLVTAPAKRRAPARAATPAAAPPAPVAPAAAKATRKPAARKAAAAPAVATPIAPIATRAAVVEPAAEGPVDPGLRRSRGDLLMVLRARTGATSIYSASQRRMVPLHYP